MLKQLSEIPALEALVALGNVTFTANTSGSWSDIATWVGGAVPTAGARVLIGAGVTITYDMDVTTRIDWIRIEGSLIWAIDRNTQLYVDTFIVNRDATLEIGSVAAPLPSGFTARIVFTDNGDLDPATDSLLIGRGLISLGAVNMHGAPKTTFGMVLVAPLATDTSVSMVNTPQGWQAGDTIIIGGTRYYGEKWNGSATVAWPSEDEERVISSMVSGTANFAGGLANNHVVNDFSIPAWDLETHVMNLTRNVRFSSENGAGAQRQRRGHVMFMHNPATDIRYVEFLELGRTEKRYKNGNNYAEAKDAFEFSPLLANSNVKARYACHFHKHGVSSLDFADQSFVIGCTVRGSPGWGLAQHDSNVLMYQNTVYDVDGSGIVSEAGNERGLWKENCVMGCQADRVITAKLTEAVSVGFDFGRNGDAMRNTSRQIRMIDNVAQSCNGGSSHFHRGRTESAPLDGKIRLNATNLDIPDLFGFTETNIRTNRHPILHHSGQISIACNFGIIVEKARSEQNHDLRTVFQDFKIYNQVRAGVEFNYTSHYTAKNGQVLGFDDGVPQQNTSESGLATHANSFDIAFVAIDVETCEYITDMSNKFTTQAFHSAGMPNRAHQVSDLMATDFTAGHDKPQTSWGQQWPPAYTLTTAPDLQASFAVTMAGPNTYSGGLFTYYTYGGGNFSYDFSKTDSLGTVAGKSAAENYRFLQSAMVGFIQTLGYWTDAAGDNWLMLPIYTGDRGTGEPFKFFAKVRLTVNLTSGLYSGGTAHGLIDFNAPPDTENLVVSSVFPPLNGRLSDNGNGTYEYYPDPGFNNVDTTKYWLTDQKGYIQEHSLPLDGSAVAFPNSITVALNGNSGIPVYSKSMSLVAN